MSTVAEPVAKTYPLRSLIPSESNVRKKTRTPQSILSLAVSINAHGGLLQNLVVVPEFKGGQRTGRASVAAGESRRQALRLLAEGKVPGAEGFTLDFPVPVKEVDEAEAVAASTTENVQREAMHPADQFEAFRAMHEQCGSVEQVAAMFSVTPLVVERRLRLAAASPRLFALYREDRMTLEQLMALCVTEDHAAQERVWDAAKGQDWNRNPANLRAALTREEMSSDSALVRFVTLKAYEAAGGAVRRDLFADEDQGWVMQPELLHRLAAERLDKAAATVRKEGWAWVEVRGPGAPGAVVAHVRFERASKAVRTLSDNERAKLADLQAQAATAEAALDAIYDKEDDETLTDDDTARLPQLRRAHQDAQGALSKYRQGLEEWTAEVKAVAGALISVESTGKLQISRGLIRPQDRKAAARAQAHTNDRAHAEGAADDAAASSGAGDSGGAVEGAEPKRGPSESLVRRLTAHRTVALQRLLADNTHVALATLAHTLVQRVLDDKTTYRTISALGMSAQGCAGQLDAATESSINAARAWRELQALREAWGERIPGDQDKLLGWLIRLPLNELCDLLALCTALTVNAVQPRDIAHTSDALAAAVGLDMADWWEPTAAEYLDCVPKALVAEALDEAGLRDEAVAVAKLKKSEAVARAEVALSGKRWLPKVLRSRAD